MIDGPRLGDRSPVRPDVRIVHLGLGAFCRAHVCSYLQDLGDWGVLGVSLRSPAVRDAMRPRDFRYTAAALTSDGMQLRDIDVVRDVLVAPENPAAVIAAMVDPAVTLVTLTVTEKGYCHDPATGALNHSHPAIQSDIAAREPQSAIGFLVRALQARRAAGTPPFVVLSCDNLPDNGALTRRVVVALAREIDIELAGWIEEQVKFPSSMVDRIVPATTPQDIANIETLAGQPDAAAVLHEPFSQWVISNEYTGDVPDLATVGAQIVPDIAPFEDMKLRMLNGAHSALAYLGPLAGHQTVADAVADPELAQYLDVLWTREIIPALSGPHETNLNAYAKALLTRFSNTGLRHRLAQIAMDGSQKLPQRLLSTLDQNLESGLPCPAILLAVAGWIAHTKTVGDADDPLADILRRCHSDDSAHTVSQILALEEIFDANLAAFMDGPLTETYSALHTGGVRTALRRLGQ